MENSFKVFVESPQEAKKILDTLAEYDLFQLKNNIKPDFSNAGGLEIWDGENWTEWYSENGEDIDNYTNTQ